MRLKNVRDWVSPAGRGRCGRTQKNRFRNQSGERGKNQKNEEINGGNNLPVVSQGGGLHGPALQHVSVVEVQHVAKVLLHLTATKCSD